MVSWLVSNFFCLSCLLKSLNDKHYKTLATHGKRISGEPFIRISISYCYDLPLEWRIHAFLAFSDRCFCWLTAAVLGRIGATQGIALIILTLYLDYVLKKNNSNNQTNKQKRLISDYSDKEFLSCEKSHRPESWRDCLAYVCSFISQGLYFIYWSWMVSIFNFGCVPRKATSLTLLAS